MNEFKVNNIFKNEDISFQEIINDMFIEHLKSILFSPCNN